MATVIKEAPKSREKWLEERKQRLGATDVSAVLGLNPYKTAYEVWLDKRDLLESWEGNAATELGTRLEPALLDEAEARWGELQRNVVAVCEDAPIAATLDGWLVEREEVVEAKTAGLLSDFADVGEWGDEHTDEIPEQYIIQTQVQLLCSGAQVARVIALVNGRGILAYRVERDDAVTEIIRAKCADWWQRHIVEGIEPEKTIPPAMEVIKRIRREPNSVVSLGEEACQFVDRLETAKAEAKAANDEVEKLKGQLCLSLGTAEGGLLPDGRMLTYLEQSRKSYTVAAAKFRLLRVKKGK